MAAALKKLAVVLAAVAGAGACATITRQPADLELTAASWNIQAGGKGLDSIVHVIRALGADVIALQEVDVHWSERSQFADQATELATRLGMEMRFAPIYTIPAADRTKPPRQFGVALISRFPVVEFRNDSLTRLSTQEPGARPARLPGLLDATVVAGGRRVRVLTAHLDYRPDPAVRHEQVAELLRALDRSPMPALVMGDFNATPDAPELRPLLDRLRDAWTSAPGNGWTYPADRPVKRIDYVLASGLSVLSARVPVSTAADHRPVVARLRLR